MILHILKHRSIQDIQKDFEREFPFLKLIIYPRRKKTFTGNNRIALSAQTILEAAGILKEGQLEIPQTMTVAQLENCFTEFGLELHVCRKSGVLWLETIMTNTWTLKNQDCHGRELSGII